MQNTREPETQKIQQIQQEIPCTPTQPIVNEPVKNDFIVVDDDSSDTETYPTGYTQRYQQNTPKPIREEKKPVEVVAPVAPAMEEEEEEEEIKPKKKPAAKKTTAKKPAAKKESKAKDLPVGSPNCLKGLAIVMTGTNKSLTRNEMTDLIKSHGGSVCSSITSKANCLVYGAKLEGGRPVTESSKYKTAVSKGLQIMSEDELYAMIRDSNPGGNNTNENDDEEEEEMETEEEEEMEEEEEEEVKPVKRRGRAAQAAKTKTTSRSRKSRKDEDEDEDDDLDGFIVKDDEEEEEEGMEIEEEEEEKPKGRRGKAKTTKTTARTKKAAAPKEKEPAENATVTKRKVTGGYRPQWLGPERDPPKHGLKAIPVGAPNCLENVSFVLTGLNESLTRDEVTELIKKYGGVVRSAISGKTNYLLAGFEMEDGRPITEGSKYKNALAKGTKIINEDDLFTILRESNPAESAKAEAQQIIELRKREEMEMKKQEELMAAAKAANTSLASSTKDNLQSSLLTVKYAPRQSEQIIGNATVLENLKLWLEQWDDVIINSIIEYY